MSSWLPPAATPQARARPGKGSRARTLAKSRRAARRAGSSRPACWVEPPGVPASGADARKGLLVGLLGQVGRELAAGFGRMLHERDDPPRHEPRRAHRRTAAGDLGDLDDAAAGGDLDAAPGSGRPDV